MKTFYSILLLLMLDFILLNQILFPLLSCGSTIGESFAFLSIVILITVNYTLIKKLLKITKNQQNEKN